MIRSKISPCLWFDGYAEEAANFYVSLFRNSEITRTVPRPDGGVLVVEFVLDGCSFLALNGGPEFSFTEAISLSVDCHSQEEVDYFWERLTDGGQPSQCGWLKDRFGVSWQIVPSELSAWVSNGTAEQTQRVMAALMKMSRLEIAVLRAAYDGTPPA